MADIVAKVGDRAGNQLDQACQGASNSSLIKQVGPVIGGLMPVHLALAAVLLGAPLGRDLVEEGGVSTVQ
jgi:hypothetical protein